MKMKILYLNDFYDFGGAEYVLHSIANHFKNKNEVYVYTYYKDQPRTFFRKMLRYMSSTSKNFITHPLMGESLKKIIEDVNPDIIHAHNTSLFCHLPQIFSKKYDIPIVYTIHDYWMVSPDRNKPNASNARVIPKLPLVNEIFFPVFRRRVLKGVNLISFLTPNVKLVAVSNYVQNVLENYFSSEILCTIRNGIDLSELNQFQYMPSEKQVNPEKEQKIFLFTGGSNSFKGFNEVIKVANKLKTDKRCRFVITGINDLILQRFFPKAEQNSQTSQFYYRNNLEFRGRLNRRPFLECLNNSSCLLFPSRWPEPCPITVLEAMALGKPVIGYDVGGLPEMVLSGKTGFLAKEGEYNNLQKHIEYMLDNPDEMRKIGARCTEFVREFWTSDQMYSQYNTLYNSLVGK